MSPRIAVTLFNKLSPAPDGSSLFLLRPYTTRKPLFRGADMTNATQTAAVTHNTNRFLNFAAMKFTVSPPTLGNWERMATAFRRVCWRVS
jgi:hypothetical protein